MVPTNGEAGLRRPIHCNPLTESAAEQQTGGDVSSLRRPPARVDEPDGRTIAATGTREMPAAAACQVAPSGRHTKEYRQRRCLLILAPGSTAAAIARISLRLVFGARVGGA